jgi:hypothetical protein
VIYTFLPEARARERSAYALALGAREAREHDFPALEPQTPHQSWKEPSRHDQGGESASLALPLAASTPGAVAVRVPHATVGCMGQPEEMNPTRADLEEEEDIPRLQGQWFDGEEITGQQVLLVLAQARHARCGSGEHALPQEE